MFFPLIVVLGVLGCQAQPIQDNEINGCDNNATVCYDPCGCFDNYPPFDDRPLPEDPNDQGLEYRLFTQENPDVPIIIEWNNDVQVMIDQLPGTYDPSLPTKFLVHGWGAYFNGLGDVKYCPNDDSGIGPGEIDLDFVYADSRYGFNDIKDAWLELYDYNVFIVYWREGAGHLNYGQSSTNARAVGACTAHFAMLPEVATDIKESHCVGHSLGGQFCGYVGQYTGGTMGRVTGLDPAGPVFDVPEPEVRLDRTDADLVDIIYTNVNDSATLINYGLGKPVGHKDFYPNGGGRQPQCSTSGCDHGAPLDYYYSSIKSSCVFVSAPCLGWEQLDSGECYACNGECQNMGYYVDEKEGEGTYYLETLEDYPYCMGNYSNMTP